MPATRNGDFRAFNGDFDHDLEAFGAVRLRDINVFAHLANAAFQLVAGFNQVAFIQNHVWGDEHNQFRAVTRSALVAKQQADAREAR
jgi:hypothetical protein